MSGDSQGKKQSTEIGFDVERALQAISKLRDKATAVAKIQLPKSGSNWGSSQTLAGFRGTFFDTMIYVGDAISATEEFSKSMADNIEAHLHELDETDRAAAEEILRVLRELESTQVNESQVGIGVTPVPAPTRNTPGNRSGIEAIMQGDPGGSSSSDGKL